ncbi:MAG: nucleotide exchange factor GrpE [Betaproteobacteria bacterium]|nr:nucleotide exchange factor GrpE [Betaproteobacteria bacterium]
MPEQSQPSKAPQSSPEQPAEAAPTAAQASEDLTAAAEPSLESLLAEAQQRIDEQREAALRALAEAENARKRAQAEVANAHKFALEKFARALLPVVDSLEAALGTENASADTLKSGAELTLKQLRAALGNESVTEIAPAAGERFDPNWHQAMAAVEVANAEPNTIVAVMQKGWRLHDRVLRPALVTVAKAPPANDA